MDARLESRIAGYPDAGSGIMVAFSGGVDSAVVLTAACCAVDERRVEAVYFSTMLHPAREREDAESLAKRLGVRFTVLEADELSEAGIERNPPDRCYRCKRLLFTKLRERAARVGVKVLLDGTNADDLGEFRPGLKAIGELGILSPLAELGYRKEDVRRLARDYGLAVSDKPSSPCLATRMEYGAPLRREDLERIRLAEEFLRDRGFDVSRVRLHRGIARIEVPAEEIGKIASRAASVAKKLHALGFDYVTLDLDGFCSGSMDINLKKHKKPEHA